MEHIIKDLEENTDPEFNHDGIMGIETDLEQPELEPMNTSENDVAMCSLQNSIDIPLEPISLEEDLDHEQREVQWIRTRYGKVRMCSIHLLDWQYKPVTCWRCKQAKVMQEKADSDSKKPLTFH